jgi:hypothetical protein
VEIQQKARPSYLPSLFKLRPKLAPSWEEETAAKSEIRRLEPYPIWASEK